MTGVNLPAPLRGHSTVFQPPHPFRENGYPQYAASFQVEVRLLRHDEHTRSERADLRRTLHQGRDLLLWRSGAGRSSQRPTFLTARRCEIVGASGSSSTSDPHEQLVQALRVGVRTMIARRFPTSTPNTSCSSPNCARPPRGASPSHAGCDRFGARRMRDRLARPARVLVRGVAVDWPQVGLDALHAQVQVLQGGCPRGAKSVGLPRASTAISQQRSNRSRS